MLKIRSGLLSQYVNENAKSHGDQPSQNGLVLTIQSPFSRTFL